MKGVPLDKLPVLLIPELQEAGKALIAVFIKVVADLDRIAQERDNAFHRNACAWWESDAKRVKTCRAICRKEITVGWPLTDKIKEEYNTAIRLYLAERAKYYPDQQEAMATAFENRVKEDAEGDKEFRRQIYEAVKRLLAPGAFPSFRETMEHWWAAVEEISRQSKLKEKEADRRYALAIKAIAGDDLFEVALADRLLEYD